MLSALLIDLRQAFRGLARAPLFTAAAVSTLALGIGLDSAMLAAFDRLLLRPLPIEDPGTLVGVYEADTQLGWTNNVLSAPNFVDFQRHATLIEPMAAHIYTVANLNPGEETVRVLAGRVTHTFFPALRVQPALGRNFTEEEDRRDGPKAVILTDEFWRSQFGAAPSIVGQTIRLEGVPHEVVGVLPAGFHVAGQFGGRIYLPMAFAEDDLADRGRHAFSALGRLKPGASVAAADAELKQVARQLASLYPDTNEHGSATVELLVDSITDSSVPYAVLFVSLASFLLLIACANVSNLILARGATRGRELAIRSAMGAGRGALIRHLAAESLWLGLGGAVLSLLVADGLVGLIRHWFGEAPQIAALTLDPRALGIGLMVTLAATVISGLAPAWRLSRSSAVAMIHDGSRGSAGRRQQRFQAALLSVQVALSVVLLTGSGLMVRTLVKLQRVPLGFEPANVLTADVALTSSRYPTSVARQEFAWSLRESLGALPHVERAAVANSVPFGGSYGNWTFAIEGREAESDQGVIWVHAVSSDYFAVLGISLKVGRLLEDTDAESCLVNDAFARRHWPDGDPLGARVQLSPPQGPTCTIVGVVGDAYNYNLADDPVPQIYAPLFQDEFQGNRYLHAYVLTGGDPSLLIGPLKQAVRDLDPDLAAQPVRPLAQLVDRAIELPRVITSLFAGFAILGLILAAVGLYGLMSFTVSRRKREMGIRQALGADMACLVRMVLGQSLRHVLWGMGLGLAACLALGHLIASFLFGVTPTDLPTLSVVALVIVTVSVLAALVPALRAAGVQPAQALREE